MALAEAGTGADETPPEEVSVGCIGLMTDAPGVIVAREVSKL